MFARMPLVVTALAALPLLAFDAHAGGGLSIGYSKHGQHSSIGVQIGFPVHAPRPAPPRYGGHWETVVEREWVPGACEKRWVAPIYETRYDSCGRRIQVCVRAGYWDTVQYPGYYEERTRKVWREAGWRGYRHAGRDRHHDDD